MARRKKDEKLTLPIEHWSHSSLMAFLRNPLVWYKRYVEQIYDDPMSPASVVGQAGHVALQHFYGGIGKEGAVELGLEYLRNIADFEIDFGKARSKMAKKKKRESMEREYLQAVSFYLAKPPRHKVLGVEHKSTVEVEGFALPLKAVSDLVVVSRADPDAVDIIDHKFVSAWSPSGADKTLFIMQALFNYYTVKESFGLEPLRFIVYECKKSKNADGGTQLRRYIIDYRALRDEFALFQKLINDATAEIARPRIYLPNPSDMFDGEHSFDLYRLGLIDQ